MAGVASAIIGGIGVVEGGVKMAEGLSQKAEARRLARNNPFVPEQMPGQVKQATQLAQENYTNGMPGQTYARQNITRNARNAQTFAAKGASSGGDILDAANKIQLSENDATQELAMQAASYKSNALGGYEAALGNEAGWQDKLYKNNQLDPYIRTANTAASMYGAGSINEFAGLDDIAGSAQAGIQDLQNTKYRNFLMKGGKPPVNSYASAMDSPINTNQIIAQSQFNQLT